MRRRSPLLGHFVPPSNCHSVCVPLAFSPNVHDEPRPAAAVGSSVWLNQAARLPKKSSAGSSVESPRGDTIRKALCPWPRPFVPGLVQHESCDGCCVTQLSGFGSLNAFTKRTPDFLRILAQVRDCNDSRHLGLDGEKHSKVCPPNNRAPVSSVFLWKHFGVSFDPGNGLTKSFLEPLRSVGLPGIVVGPGVSQVFLNEFEELDRLAFHLRDTRRSSSASVIRFAAPDR